MSRAKRRQALIQSIPIGVAMNDGEEGDFVPVMVTSGSGQPVPALAACRIRAGQMVARECMRDGNLAAPSHRVLPVVPLLPTRRQKIRWAWYRATRWAR